MSITDNNPISLIVRYKPCFPFSIADGVFLALPIELTLVWTNLSLRFATEFATEAHVWRSVGARLHLGQLHKSLIDKYKSFIHNSLQTDHTDQIFVNSRLISSGSSDLRGRRISTLAFWFLR